MGRFQQLPRLYLVVPFCVYMQDQSVQADVRDMLELEFGKQ